MGLPERHDSVRAFLAFTGIAAVATSAMLVVGSIAASAQTEELVIGPGVPIATSEGTQVADQPVGTFIDNGLGARAALAASPQQPSECDLFAQQTYQVKVDWLGDGTFTSDNVSVSCGEGFFIISGTYTYKDSGTFKISVSVKDTSDDQTASGESDTAAISDQAISPEDTTNVTGTEGGTTTVHVLFRDSNHAYSASEGVDPGLTATIDWGDGSTSAGTVAWNDSSSDNVMVSGSHPYDANIPATKAYNVKVTLKDDGNVEAQATDTLTATIADAALTPGAAKTFSATATKASTPTVGTFTDAAAGQAAASDFNATIYWGDSTQSSGSVTKTGTGAFSVSATHTYATTGSKTLTIVVSDEEGKTVTLAATALVGAAPVVLPLTGQPHQPALPGVPMWPLALVVLGLCGVAVGVVTNRLQRIRH